MPHFAAKAGENIPSWVRDAVQLRNLLQGAWDEVSSEWIDKLVAAVGANDTAAINALLGNIGQLGTEFETAVGSGPQVVTSNLLFKAETFYTLYAKSIGIETPATWTELVREEMAAAAARQIKAFARAYPDRMLHPEILRQIDYLNETTTPDPLRIATIKDQLKQVLKDRPQNYFDGLSDTHVARLWHVAGVEIAQNNGIAVLRITGPLDKKTCPVCRHLLGLEFNVADMLEHAKAGMVIEDPDEYVKFWKFPRIDDVDNKSVEEKLKAIGPMPVPAHPRCRHGYGWARLSKQETETVSKPVEEVVEEPTRYPLKMRPLDRVLLKPPTLKEATKEFKRTGEWTYHTLESVPISSIQVPPVWNEKRIASVTKAIESNTPMPPVQLSEDPVSKKLKVSDGIHRTNASIQAGFTDVPAIVNRIETEAPTAERLKQIRVMNKAEEKRMLPNVS